MGPPTHPVRSAGAGVEEPAALGVVITAGAGVEEPAALGVDTTTGGGVEEPAALGVDATADWNRTVGPTVGGLLGIDKVVLAGAAV